MPLIQEHSLADLFDQAPLVRSIDRLTRDVGEDLTDTVRRRTPIANLPPGVTGEMRGRMPGTLKASWYTTDVERRRTIAGVEGRAIESRTDDEIAPHVEWPTMPHIIRPSPLRAPASVVATRRPRRIPPDPQAALRYVNRFGRVVYAHEVHHPGTQGTHMMRDSLAEIDATWPSRHGAREVRRWAREQVALVR